MTTITTSHPIWTALVTDTTGLLDKLAADTSITATMAGRMAAIKTAAVANSYIKRREVNEIIEAFKRSLSYTQ